MSPAKRTPGSKNDHRRVLIVDDHPMVRERLAQVISAEADLEVCGEAEDRWQALEIVKQTNPHLVIVDLTLKNSHGLELIKDLRYQTPETRVLVVSMHDEAIYAERALKGGAHGYITKQEATREVVHAIRRVFEGGIYLSDTMANKILVQVAGHQELARTLTIDLLSDRELQVLELLGQGMSTRQIAERLHLDSKTIETYRTRIKEKLGLRDSGELLQTAIQWVHSARERAARNGGPAPASPA